MLCLFSLQLKKVFQGVISFVLFHSSHIISSYLSLANIINIDKVLSAVAQSISRKLANENNKTSEIRERLNIQFENASLQRFQV